MRFAAGNIFLISLVLLESMEFIISAPRTLEDLFPGYKGIMPPVVESWTPEHKFDNFETFDGKTLMYDSVTYVQRDHIIFGYEDEELIEPPCHLFELENISIAFDTKKDEWITLPSYLSHELGVGRYIELLQARDEVAETHVSTSNYPIYKKAHLIACQEANARAHIVEEDQLKLLKERNTTLDEIASKIKEEYSNTYNRAFTRHLHQHGEYNIHGQRERRQ